MKKKIEDLTISDLRCICGSHCYCDDCPLHKFMLCFFNPYDFTETQLKEEVEI